MNRNIIGTLAVLVLLIGIASVPVNAAVTTIAWTDASAQIGTSEGYSYTTQPPGVYFWLNITDPSGLKVKSSSVFNGTGSGTWTLSKIGTWTVSIGNATNTASDTIDVPALYWPSITDLVGGLGTELIPAFVSLVTSWVPLAVILIVMGFVLVFMRKILDHIHI